MQQTVVVRKNSPLSSRLKAVSQVHVIEISKPFFLHLSKLAPFSMIHAHEAKAAHLGFFCHLLYSIPYIITRRVIKRPKVYAFFSWVHRRAATVVAISSPVRKALQDIDPRIRTRVIFSVFAKLDVDPVETARLRSSYENKFVVGHVGALVNKDKGQTHIIRVAQKIRHEYPDIHFLFLGEGADRALFISQARGTDNIEFVGFKENIGDYYAVFDIFLFPSLDEGLGSAILDAFNFDLPVIAAETGGIPDIITDGKNGRLISPGDEAAMYGLIKTLYENPNYRRKLSENGKNSLYRFTIQNASRRYLDLYETVLGSTP